MSENPTPETPDEGTEGEQQQTFTQADVERIAARARAEARREAQRAAAEKYADYDDLKAKAGEARTAEERITALEQEIQATRLDAARARIAAEFELTEKQTAALKYAPSEEAAREIAEGLAAEASERKKQGNHVPREGNNPKAGDDPMREFARGLFARATSE